MKEKKDQKAIQKKKLGEKPTFQPKTTYKTR